MAISSTVSPHREVLHGETLLLVYSRQTIPFRTIEGYASRAGIDTVGPGPNMESLLTLIMTLDPSPSLGGFIPETFSLHLMFHIRNIKLVYLKAASHMKLYEFHTRNSPT